MNSEIRSKVNESLNNLLANIYTANGICSGDISPAQVIELEDIIDQTAVLFTTMVRQNKLNLKVTAEVKVGDIIKVGSITIKIAEIISQSYYDRDGWFIEFKDVNGRYRYWKQYDDGGELIRKDGK